MPAFRSAIALGADWIELDAHLSRDGRLVVIHDAHTGRVGDRALVAAESACDELRQVDVAWNFRAAAGLSLAECPRDEIPLLPDVIELIQSQRGTRLSIQPKASCVDECLALVQSMDACEWVGFNDGDLTKMQRVKELAAQVPVFWDRGPGTDIDADVRVAVDSGFESIVVHRAGVSASGVEAIHQAGLESGAWTVNDPEEMRGFLELRVDRLYTDAPRRMLQLRAEM